MSLDNMRQEVEDFLDRFGHRMDVTKDGRVDFQDFVAVYDGDIKKVAIASSFIGFVSGVICTIIVDFFR